MKKIDLMIPIWALYNFKNISDIVLKIDDSEYLKNVYDLEQRKSIHSALKWAKENPNFDFKGIMEDAPVSHELTFSNLEIYNYLMSFKNFMENQDYKLLTDDRPPKKMPYEK
ncbi:MAG: uncharacterized protein K0R77_3095 [Chryseobacterium sp.]|jgi:hypothetical protein|uniref:hypothetical protein n=1 Tax=Chryseobacterium sp. TaxID=1871047 RepID=UPI00261B5278|nr:hypothetical protein [Chryseobacterium sp.]MDF2553820.1 uncharacterized protein [Chryseobacterium sp.]